MKTGRSLRGWSFVLAAIAFVVQALWKPEGLIARSRTAAGGAASSAADTGRASARNVRAAQETAKGPSAGDAYMNVQVLKDIPSDQLMPAMKYISQALGVRCEFCHDPKSFDSDDKPEKGTARNMMKMMFAINKDSFNGRREVTCYTCHRGESHAANLPSLYAAGAMNGAGGTMRVANANLPPQPPIAANNAGNAAASAAPTVTVDEILAKYTDALGGAAAIQKIHTLEKKGTIDLPFNGGMKAPAEMLRKAPDRMLSVVHLSNGTEFVSGYNGTAGWEQDPGHAADDLKGDDLVREKQAASFIAGLNLKEDFSRAQVAGTDKIGDHEAYRVIAFRKGGGQVRFYFDTQSGLLLRVSQRIESPLGALPQDTDYSDYRDVNGVKVPFTVTENLVQGPNVFRWEQIHANATIDDTRFEKPAAKAAQP